jgi:hypothetical protein
MAQKPLDIVGAPAQPKEATPAAEPTVAVEPGLAPMTTPGTTPEAAASLPATDVAPAATPAEATPVAETPTPSPSEPAQPTPVATTPPQAAAAAPSGEDSFSSLFPEPSVTLAGPPAWVWWVLLGVSSVVVVILGYRLLTAKPGLWSSTTPTPTATVAALASSEPSASPSPTATPTPEATAAPVASTAPAAQKSTITLRVLNGTKTAGLAASAKTKLTTAGFTVRTTGNAANQTYTSTYIYYATGQEAAAASVKEALTSYSPVVQLSDTLAKPDNVLVVVAQ